MIVKIRGNGKVESITAQTHDWIYRNWTQGLPPAAIRDIFDAVNEYINREGRGEVVTASVILAADRDGTPYQAIYQAVGGDWNLARFFFGLIVWRVMLERPETWALGHYPRQHDDFTALTYFQVNIC